MLGEQSVDRGWGALLYIHVAKPKNPVLKGVCVCVQGSDHRSCPSFSCQINKEEAALSAACASSHKVSGEFADRKSLKLDTRSKPSEELPVPHPIMHFNC